MRLCGSYIEAPHFIEGSVVSSVMDNLDSLISPPHRPNASADTLFNIFSSIWLFTSIETAAVQRRVVVPLRMCFEP